MSDEIRALVDRRWEEYGIPRDRPRAMGTEWRGAGACGS